ncbi:unnamed protein product [Penicillium manginii]
MDTHEYTMAHASTLLARADSSGRPPVYKVIGICLAVASGVFIGISFVIKKIGLLKANVKYNEEAGEGYGYLKNFWWWCGMTLMILGEICNFVAYAFVDAILVTPLGALSVVITTILSAIFLKERLSFVGKVGCFSCIVGSVVIAMNAPEQSSVSNIQEMQHFVISPGFLTYAGVILVGALFTAVWVAPSLVGGLSVVATQGLGSAILAQINGEPQFKQWFLYVLFVFVVGTLLTEIIYLNKALNLFNAALVTPTYYVMFTTATIVTSAVLFQGFKGTAVQITTVILGFLQICAGVVLLQLSKSAKDVPDAAVFKGDLDQIREVATQEEPEYEPKADSIRGAASIIRRISTTRRTAEADEAKRYIHEKHEDFLKPPGDNEIIEWDGIRRRRTVVGEGPTMSRPITPRSPSIRQQLPPLGMSRFPDHDEEEDENRPTTKQSGRSFFGDVRSRTSSVLHPHWTPLNEQEENEKRMSGAVPDTEYHGADQAGLQLPTHRIGRERSDTPRSISWADENGAEGTDSRPGSARRQFSFNNMVSRMRGHRELSPKRSASPPRGILRRSQLVPGGDLRRTATEEEQLGLVKGDSRSAQPEAEISETLGEKLERWSSSESELSEAHPMVPIPARGSASAPALALPPPGPIPASRPHGDSVSSMSTAAFPPYEDHHAFYTQGNTSNPYYLPPSHQTSTSPERMSIGPEHDGWQHPRGQRSRTRTNSSSHARAPPPSQSSFSTHRHPNPLPPLPDREEPATTTAGGADDHGHVHDDAHNNNARPISLVRQQSGWRRHMSEASSDDGSTYETRSRPGQGH